MRRSTVLLLLLALSLGGCNACREKYFGTLEKVGLERRDLLVRRVDNAREAQEEAQEQFADALEELQALVGHDGGELEKVYGRLSGEFERSEARAEEVRDRIRKVENVARSLFSEWREELGQYSNSELRRSSERELAKTETRYEELIAAMQRAATTMDPVLDRFRDQVLFLKHNLNAQALGSLAGTLGELESEIEVLIREMQTSIREADAFIEEMKAED